MSESKIVETRKVQKFGKSTLMVSLPSEYVKMVGLKPSDLVRLEVKEDGSLIILPEKIFEKRYKGKEVKIGISRNTSEDILMRAIYASYIACYDRIVIESVEEKSISPHHMHAIRSLIRMLIGSEIVEQTSDRVVIQIFIDTERYNIDGLIARMISAIKNMLNFLVISIKNLDYEHLKEVVELEFEMDRIHALAIRYVYALNLLRSIPFVTEYRTLIKSLEDMGDALTQASQIFSEAPELMHVVRDTLGDRLDELELHIVYVMDIILQALSKGDLYIASRAVDLAIESSKFIRRMEMEVIPRYKSLDEYLKAKTFFERLLLICYNLQAASELAFDIAMGKHYGIVDLVAQGIVDKG